MKSDAFVTGITLGALLAVVVVYWIAPIVGWPALAVAYLGLVLLVAVSIWNAPLMDPES
jgi:hypothetical protein